MASQNGAGAEAKPRTRTRDRVSSALKSGVVYGGSAVLTAVNNITPHIAGAVDILVVEQPDGRRKATPFYVRFGKYTAMRTGERDVKLYINDELAPFGMHIGMYGQAYFTTETGDVAEGDEDEQEAMLAGMMSPPSGYSSGPDGDGAEAGEGAMAAAAQRLGSSGKGGSKGGSKRDASSALSESSSRAASDAARVPPPALGTISAPPLLETDTAAAAAPPLLPQLEPPQRGLSIADRNESFLSAHETLAAPLSDELLEAVTAAGGSPTLWQQQQQQHRRHSHTPRRALMRVSSSRDSLGTVSEGCSPGGWSDEDGAVDAAGTAEPSGRSGGGASLRQGSSAPTPAAERSSPELGVPEPAAEQAEGGLADALGACRVDSSTPAPLAAEDVTAAPEAPQHAEQRPLSQRPRMHTQLGFPDNPSGLAPHQDQEAVLASAVAGARVHSAVDWAHVLGSAGDVGASGGAGVVEPAAAPAPTQSAAAVSAPMAVAAGPRAQHVASGTRPCAVGSPAAADAPASGGASAAGSHGAVSLLSSSLRASGLDSGSRGGAAPAALAAAASPFALHANAQPPPTPTPQHFQPHLQPHAPQQQHVERCPAAWPPPAAASTLGGIPALHAGGGSSGGGGGAVHSGGGPIAAAALAGADRPPRTPREADRAVLLTLSVTPSGRLRARLHVPLTAAATQHVTLASGHSAPMAMAAGGAAAPGPGLQDGPGGVLRGMDEGYRGDAEPSAEDASGGAMRHHTHHHHHGRHHHHGHGHGHHRADPDLDDSAHLHSTSAPLPASTVAAAAAAAAAARGAGERSPQALEVSLCGGRLSAGSTYAEACRLFDACKMSPEAFAARGPALLASADLVVRLPSGAILPWQPLAHALLAAAAFGTIATRASAPSVPYWAPEGTELNPQAAVAAVLAALGASRGLEGAGLDAGAGGAGALQGSSGPGMVGGSATSTPKKGGPAGGGAGGAAGGGAAASGGSWRLWPFGGARRDSSGARASGTGAAAAPPLPPAVAAAAAAGSSASLLGERPSAVDLARFESCISPRDEAGPSMDAAAAAAAVAASGPSSGPSSGPQHAQEQRRRGGRQVYHTITKKSLTPGPEQLAALPLRYGQNTIKYKIGASELRAYVYFLPWRTRIVISDIDGTITRSDVLGHLLPAMGLDWSHRGIAQLLTNIRANRYLVMYLSSRSISQANITRDFINSLVQGQHRMPVGPVIISPHGLLPSLYREMILRRPHEFKIATLQDIRALFPPHWNPFYSGFGNRDTDEISYREVGVPVSRIFIINPRGELRQPAERVPVMEASASAPAILASGNATTAAPAVTGSAPAGPGAGSGSESHQQQQPAQPAAAAAAAALASPTASRSLSTASSSTVASAAAAASTGNSSGAAAPANGGAGGGAAAAPAAAGGSRARGPSPTASAAAFSTLSAINELVHDIFPPLLLDEAELLVHALMRDGGGASGGADAGGRAAGADAKAANGDGPGGTSRGSSRSGSGVDRGKVAESGAGGGSGQSSRQGSAPNSGRSSVSLGEAGAGGAQEAGAATGAGSGDAAPVPREGAGAEAAPAALAASADGSTAEANRAE